jgi:multisubunit Na+/H+ antiporter MnhF subunit
MFIKFSKLIIAVFFWIQAFAAPLILFGLLGLLIYSKGEKYFLTAILLFVIGIIGGIIVAEYIRRKIGLSTFFGRIYGPNEMDEKFKKKNQD